MSTRYGLRNHIGGAHSILPCVEVTTVTVSRRGGSGRKASSVTHTDVVKRVYGFTFEHAMIRAQRWARAHGDPR